MAGLNKPVDQIVHNHWQRFGRCYFQRHDYFIPDTDKASDLVRALSGSVGKLAGTQSGAGLIQSADLFSYTDPVDGSVSENQGYRIFFADGGRIVLRLSGTGTSGATLRVYLDRLEINPQRLQLTTDIALGNLGNVAAKIARIQHFTGLTEPSAIIR
jgi:phosphoglucomutase